MDYKYNILISDIETNAIANWQTLAGLDRLHCFTVIDPTNSNLYEFNTMKDNIEEGLQMLQDSEYICFHNGIGFDAPALYKLYGIKFNKIVDTMLMAKVLAMVRYIHKGQERRKKVSSARPNHQDSSPLACEPSECGVGLMVGSFPDRYRILAYPISASINEHNP